MNDEFASLRRQIDQAFIDTQRAHWEKLGEIAEHQTKIQGDLTTLAGKLLEHMEQEEGLMARAAEQLAAHTVQLSFLERMQYALWGALAMLGGSGVAWVLSHLTASAQR